MKKRLPDAVRALRPVERLVWLYIDRYPGEHSIKSLEYALGSHPGRALPSLLALGLVIQDEASVGTRLGKYHAVTPAQEEEERGG